MLDLTTLPLPPGRVEEEELFPDFSALGSFNFSAPSASLPLTRDIQGHHDKLTQGKNLQMGAEIQDFQQSFVLLANIAFQTISKLGTLSMSLIYRTICMPSKP